VRLLSHPVFMLYLSHSNVTRTKGMLKWMEVHPPCDELVGMRCVCYAMESLRRLAAWTTMASLNMPSLRTPRRTLSQVRKQVLVYTKYVQRGVAAVPCCTAHPKPPMSGWCHCQNYALSAARGPCPRHWKCTYAGELFAFGYNVSKQPHCTYCVIDPKGDLVLDVPVHLPK
jgi:hypothetical protein